MGDLGQTKGSTYSLSTWNLLPQDVVPTTNLNGFEREAHKSMEDKAISGHVTSKISEYQLFGEQQ